MAEPISDKVIVDEGRSHQGELPARGSQAARGTYLSWGHPGFKYWKPIPGYANDLFQCFLAVPLLICLATLLRGSLFEYYSNVNTIILSH